MVAPSKRKALSERRRAPIMTAALERTAAPMAAKAARVIKFLARDPARWYSLSELARELGLGRGTMHGLLSTLVQEGFLLRDPRDKRYALGPALVAIGEAAASHRLFGLARMASDQIRKLAATFDAQATTSCLVGDQMLILDAAGGPDSFGRVTQVGEQVPLVPPMGSVFVAWASCGDAEAWIARAHSRREPGRGGRSDGRELEESLSRLLEAVRRRGFSASVARHALGDEGTKSTMSTSLEVSYDTDLVAAPVFDANGDVVLALSLFGFPFTLDENRAGEVGLAVRNAAEVVTKRLGGDVPWEGREPSATGPVGEDAPKRETKRATKRERNRVTSLAARRETNRAADGGHGDG